MRRKGGVWGRGRVLPRARNRVPEAGKVASVTALRGVDSCGLKKGARMRREVYFNEISIEIDEKGLGKVADVPMFEVAGEKTTDRRGKAQIVCRLDARHRAFRKAPIRVWLGSGSGDLLGDEQETPSVYSHAPDSTAF
jgi:hypothetical protein